MFVKASHSLHEALLAEGLQQFGGESFAVGGGVADVGEDLCQGFGVVDADELLVLGQRLAGSKVAVNGLRRDGSVGLLVDICRGGQTVSRRGMFVGPAEGQRCHGHDEFRKTKEANDFQRFIDRRAQETHSEPERFCQVTEALTEEEDVDGSVLIGQEVAVARMSLALQCPLRGAVIVRTEGEDDGSVRHHGLVEMKRSELLLHLGVAGDNDTVELQIPHGLGTGGFFEKTLEQRLRHGTAAVTTNGLTHIIYNYAEFFECSLFRNSYNSLSQFTCKMPPLRSSEEAMAGADKAAPFQRGRVTRSRCGVLPRVWKTRRRLPV